MSRKSTGAVITTKTKTRGVSYAARFSAYGERRYQVLGYSSDGWTPAQAEDALADILADVRRGIWQPPRELEPVQLDSDPTFHQFASEWFTAIAPELKPKTAERYREQLTIHLLPYFKDYRLSQFSIAEVDKFRHHKVRERDRIALARERGDTRQKGLGNESINKLLLRLAQLLDLAVEYGHLPANPARGRRRRLKTGRPRRSYVDQARQIAALLDAAAELDGEATRYRHVGRHAMIATLVFAGLRLSELLELRWSQVDLAGGWLRVREQGDGKTAASTRRVKIRPVLRDALLERRAAVPGAGDALVFPTEHGQPHSPSNVRRRIVAKAIERANERLETPLPELTPQSLRRTFASVLYAIGEPPPVVMQEMGHTSPALALSVYAQSMSRDEDENERLRALVNGGELEEFRTQGDDAMCAASPQSRLSRL